MKYSLQILKNNNLFKRLKYSLPNALNIKYFWTLSYNYWEFLDTLFMLAFSQSVHLCEANLNPEDSWLRSTQSRPSLSVPSLMVHWSYQERNTYAILYMEVNTNKCTKIQVCNVFIYRWNSISEVLSDVKSIRCTYILPFQGLESHFLLQLGRLGIFEIVMVSKILYFYIFCFSYDQYEFLNFFSNFDDLFLSYD